MLFSLALFYEGPNLCNEFSYLKTGNGLNVDSASVERRKHRHYWKNTSGV